MPRFVVLKHIADTTHYDLMFERDGALRTFSTATDPRAAGSCEAEEIFDHPLRFLDYEGPLRTAPGRVERVERGEYRAAQWTRERLELECRGELGEYVLEFQNISPEKWLLKKIHRGKRQADPR